MSFKTKKLIFKFKLLIFIDDTSICIFEVIILKLTDWMMIQLSWPYINEKDPVGDD